MGQGRFVKGGDRLYAYNTRVPQIVRLSERSGPATRDDFVQHQDLFGSICGPMALEVPPELAADGRDIFHAESAPPEKVITAWFGNVGVRDRNWNVVIDSTGKTDRPELYDIQADPMECRNVHDARPSLVKEFTDYLERMLGKLPYEIKHLGDNRQAPPLGFVCR